MNFYNKVLDKKGLKRIVSWFIENYGPTRTSLLLDEFKYIGFHYAGKAGLSLGFDDLRIPPTKKNLLAAAQQQVQSCEKTYLMGRITAFERYQKLIDIWTTTSEKLKDEVIQNFEKIQGGPLASPLYMMAFSGARGNISQVRQLVGMRGLMSDSGGGIIDFPIRSNFREGLSVTEYVISCYGARKGLIDTALRTADSGYLTRRLVDVAHGIIIREIDCGSTESISMKISDTKNLIGRVLAETVRVGAEGLSPSRVIWRNQEISVSIVLELKNLKGPKGSVQVRSPLTCLSQSVCQLCYGWNLAQGRLVSLGEAVGILAAQSIGEPGTQLTMRTFHTGGIFSTEVEDKLYSPQDGYISLARSQKQDKHSGLSGNRSTGIFHGCKIRSVHGQTAFFFFESIQLKIKSLGIDSTPQKNRTGNGDEGVPATEKESILELPAQSILFISPGNKIAKNTLFAEISRIKQPTEKVNDKNNTESSQFKNTAGANPTGSIDTVTTDKKKGTPNGGTSVEIRPLVPLAHKKVFSEIEGEVIEKIFPNFVQPVGSGTTDPNWIKSIPFAQPPTFEKENSRKALGMQASLPRGHSAEFKKYKATIKSRVVLAGEPFLFKRKKATTEGPEDQRTKGLWRGVQERSSAVRDAIFIGLHPSPQENSTPRQRSKDSIGLVQTGNTNNFIKSGFEKGSRIVGPLASLSGENGLQSSNPLPFRTGDIVFWKGKRKLNGLRMNHFLEQRKSFPNLQKRTNRESKKLTHRLTGPEASTIHVKGSPEQFFAKHSPLSSSRLFPFVSGDSSFKHTLEIRRIEGTSSETENLPKEKASIRNRDSESKNGDKGLLLLSNSGSGKKTGDKLTYSGLILRFEHQKERKQFCLSSADLHSGFTPKKQNIGDIFQPYVAWAVAFGSPNIKGCTQNGKEPRNDVGNKGLGGLNIPTQIIRKRKNKVILRHVQTHLGADIQAPPMQAMSPGVSEAPKILDTSKESDSYSLGGLPGFGSSQGVLRAPKNTQRKKLLSSVTASSQHYVKQRDLVFQLVLPISQSSSSSDIVQGLPKIEQLFEARTRTLEARGNVGGDTSTPQPQRGTITGTGVNVTANKTELKLEKSHNRSDSGNTNSGPAGKTTGLGIGNAGARFEKTSEDSGSSYSQSKTALRSLQKRLIQEIQSVYNSQGVDIADKHLEIIVRQMTSRIRVLEKGNTPFFPDDIVSGLLLNFPSKEETENKVSPDGKLLVKASPVFDEIPAYEWVLMGITKVALLATTESYISAASFQETKRVLMNSALQNRVDFFEGLKENVIVGRMIPAGTGYSEFL